MPTADLHQTGEKDSVDTCVLGDTEPLRIREGIGERDG